MKKAPKKTRVKDSDQATYVLRLYVSGSTLKSQRAVANIELVCEEHLQGRYDLEVIDIHQHASLARDEQIVAVPCESTSTSSVRSRREGTQS